MSSDVVDLSFHKVQFPKGRKILLAPTKTHKDKKVTKNSVLNDPLGQSNNSS